MTKKHLRALSLIFWSALGVTVVGLGGSIIEKVIEKKTSTRTDATTTAPIPVPAEPSP